MSGTIFDADVIVIGAGLTGLKLAKNLQDIGKTFIILEARDRIGGRINTVTASNGAAVELGATWFFPHFKNLFKLLESLSVGLNEQFMQGYTMYEVSKTSPARKIHTDSDHGMYRISGGTSSIVNALYEQIEASNVFLSQKVAKISKLGQNHMKVETQEGREFNCKTVVTTLPPQLLAGSIVFVPPLPNQVVQVMKNTHTWMGDSVKAIVTYTTPWWKEKNLCGTLYSNVGPVIQFHDQSDEHGSAIVGFLDDSIAQLSFEKRRDLVIDQLIRVFGEPAKKFMEYKDTAWKEEQFTMPGSFKDLHAHSNNGHAIYQKAHFDGNLIIGGTETSPKASGYMEGAVVSANQISRMLANGDTL